MLVTESSFCREPHFLVSPTSVSPEVDLPGTPGSSLPEGGLNVAGEGFVVAHGGVVK